jgi:hypothetical protein
MQAVMRTTLSNTQVLLKAIVTTDFKEIDRYRGSSPDDRGCHHAGHTCMRWFLELTGGLPK